jgi:cytochrome c-type biogenesis protein CcmH/NrfG
MPQLARLARPVAPDVPAAPQQPRTVDHELVAERILLGDRMFRAKNFPRAVQRYEQALKENPRSIEARLRLAQVAIERDRFREAIEFLSEAQEIDPRWLTRPDDVQALYKEPNDYARLITRLESHLQAHPDDRDAWLVLGAQLFFTGRTVDAADAFLRLTDRRPDELLQAFLDQTEPVR